MMPKDAVTKDLPAEITAWIDAFNKARGWRTLSAPKPDGVRLMKTPEHRFTERHQQATAEVAEAFSELRQIQRKVEAVRAQAEALDPGDARARVEVHLERFEDQEANAKAEYQAKRALQQRRALYVQQLSDIESDLRSDLTGTRRQIDALEERVEGQADDPTATMDKDVYRQFQWAHDGARDNIEHARAQIVEMEKAGDGGVIRSYAAINVTEYKILYGMLEKAMLTFRLGDVDGATAIIRDTNKKLGEFRAARTEMKIHRELDSFDSRLESELDQIRANIGTMRSGGFAAAADKYETANRVLVAKIQQLHKTSPDTVYDTFSQTVSGQAIESAQAAGGVREYLKYHARIMDQIKSLRVVGSAAAAAADLHQDALERHVPGENVGTEIYTIKGRLDAILADLKILRGVAMRAENIDVEALNGQLAGLKAGYDEMFKHKRDGTIRTQKDSQTQKAKGVKKDRKIPREALDEIELKLLAADQLLASNSVDAVREAQQYLDEVQSFAKSVGEEPDDYKLIASQMKDASERIARMATKYAAYEIARRMDLKARQEKFEGAYRGQSPEMSKDQSNQLFIEAKALKVEVQGLAGLYNQFGNDAKKADKLVANLGKRISEFQIGDVAIEGYHGQFVNQLRDARSTADDRDEASLKTAQKDVTGIIESLEEQIAVVKKRAGADRSVLDGAELAVWSALKSDAVAGQLHQNEIAVKQAEFNDKQAALSDKIDGLVKRFKELKLDPTDVEVAKQRIDALKKEMAASDDYDDALSRLAALDAEAARMDATATEMADFKALGVDKAARQCTDNIRSFTQNVSDFINVIKATGDVAAELALSEGDLRDYLKTVSSAIKDSDLTALEANAKTLAAATVLDKPTRQARESALATVRSMMAALQDYAPVLHYRLQPFTAGDPAYYAALKALPRLEIKLLTAIAR